MGLNVLRALGRTLRPLRSGTARLAENDARVAAPATLLVTSPEFASGATMPAAYRGTDGVSPPLEWAGLPEAARELVLVVEDADVPMPRPLVHALAYAMPASKRGLRAGEIPRLRPRAADRIPGASLGKGAGIAPGWVPVTPIPGHGPHRYVFQLFALRTPLPLFARPPSRTQLLNAMSGRVLARGSCVGLAEA